MSPGERYNGPMGHQAFNMAIETSGRGGSVALGRGGELIRAVRLPEPRRHRLDLMPVIDELCSGQGVSPRDIGEIYVSIGPGSFTGLRIGVTTAKMLARVIGSRIVAVPTLHVVAQNAPAEAAPCLAVCLSLKHTTMCHGLFRHDGSQWIAQREPELTTLTELLAAAPRPLALLGDPLGDVPPLLDDQVTILPSLLALPRAEALWRLGRQAAQRGEFTNPLELLPLYVREPEAQILWNRRHGESATMATPTTRPALK